MSDEELVRRLREVNAEAAPYANATVREWCHAAADAIERLTRERATDWADGYRCGMDALESRIRTQRLCLQDELRARLQSTLPPSQEPRDE